jgi:uncharacterized protein YcfL
MKKLIYVFVCMGLLAACNSESTKKDAASDTAKTEASQTNASSTASEAVPAMPSSSSVAEQTNNQPTTIDPALKNEVEQQVQAMQKNLPIKMNGMDITSVKVDGNALHYSLTYNSKDITSKQVPVEQLKRNLLMFCGQPDTKRFINGGYDFKYTYHFQDKSQVDVIISAKDCV